MRKWPGCRPGVDTVAVETDQEALNHSHGTDGEEERKATQNVC